MTLTSDTIGTLSLPAYYDALKRFDWSYDESDDYSRWQRESKAHARLKAYAKASPQHLELLKLFERYGADWGRRIEFREPGTPPMPGRPGE